jgi:peptidoglycan hydrolase-like protein with peptidoglycan-binding domain
MRYSTTIFAGLGLIGGVCCAGVAPGLASTSPTAAIHGNTTGTGHQPNAQPMQRAEHTMPLHRVALLQEALDSEGAHLSIDGIRGPATEAALKQFQRQHGPQASGELDRATRAQLVPTG